MAQIITVPKAIMQRNGWIALPTCPTSASAWEAADIVSTKRFGVKAGLVSQARRELLLDAMTKLWADFDALDALDDRKGQAS